MEFFSLPERCVPGFMGMHIPFGGQAKAAKNLLISFTFVFLSLFFPETILSDEIFFSENIPPAINLAPELSLTNEEFREKFRAMEFLLSHKGVNSYIRRLLEIKKLRETEDVLAREIKLWDTNIPIISIPGLLSNTGQFAHVGLGSVKGSPVIYVDSSFFYNDTIVGHEIEEIAQWERLRRELGLSRKDLRKWILSNIEDAREKAQRFHIEAEKKFPLRHLYEKYADSEDFDMRSINSLMRLVGPEDINIAAGGNVADPESADLSVFEIREIYDTVLDIARSVTESASLHKAAQFFSGKIDRRSADEAGRAIASLIYIAKISEAGMEIDSGVVSFEGPFIMSGFEREVSKVFSNILRDMYVEGREDIAKREFGEYLRELELFFIDLVPLLGKDVARGFLMFFEEYALRKDLSDLPPFAKAEMVNEIPYALKPRQKDKWLEIIRDLMSERFLGYGSFTGGMFFSFAYQERSEAEKVDLENIGELIRSKAVGDELLLEMKLSGILDRVIMAYVSQDEEGGVTFSEIGLYGEPAGTLERYLVEILDNSQNPFLKDYAFRIYDSIKDIPLEKRMDAWYRLCLDAVSGVESPEKRWWMISRITPEVSFYPDDSFERKRKVFVEFFRDLFKGSHKISPHVIAEEAKKQDFYEDHREIADRITYLILRGEESENIEHRPLGFLREVKALPDLMSGFLSEKGVSPGEIEENLVSGTEVSAVKRIFGKLEDLGILERIPEEENYVFSSLLKGQGVEFDPFIDIIAGRNFFSGRDRIDHADDILRSGEDQIVRDLIANIVDIEHTKRLANSFQVPPPQARVYNIRYNVAKLSHPQMRVVEEYAKRIILQMGKGTEIRANGFWCEDDDTPLISVTLKTEEYERVRDIRVLLRDNEEVSDYPLRICGVLNLAIAACELPEDTELDMRRYFSLLSFMQSQYRSLTGISLELPRGSSDIDLFVRRILMLELPPAERKNYEKLELFYKNTIEILISA